MNVAILTYVAADNAGAVLQCYALKKFLEKNGLNVNVINYRPYYLTDQYGYWHNPFSFLLRKGMYRTLTRIRSDILNLKNNYHKTHAYNRFRIDYLGITKPQAGPKNSRELYTYLCSNKMDAIIVGSDQVWRPVSNSEPIDAVFLLDFASNFHILKIAYAVSLGNQKNENVFSDLESEFDYVSVREKESIDIIGKKYKRGVEYVVDPTFLIEPDAYFSIIDKYNCCYAEPFIFVYSLEYDERISGTVDYIICKEKMPIMYYSSSKYNFKNAKRIEYISPESFLWFINNA